MGARAAIGCANSIASELETASQESFISGVVCFAYPLHPPKQQDKLRDQPLFQIKAPCLFISGDKDEMGDKALLEGVVAKMDKSSDKVLKWISGGTHGFAVRGRSKDEVEKEVCDICIDWCAGIGKMPKYGGELVTKENKKGKRKGRKRSAEVSSI